MLISAVRCTLSYLVFPFVLPLIGITAGLDSGVGLIVGPIAIAANLFSIHRFWSADHKYKVQTSMLNVAMIVALAVLLVGDVNDVLS
jgi:hypothetical protein